jgi:hypothetical protein
MPVPCTPALRKVLSATLTALALALPAWAAPSDDLFTVRDVSVDVTADSATAARDRGIREGQRKAFESLFDRLTPDSARSALSGLDGTSIDQMVQSFEVQEERTSAVRYLGRLAVTFNAQAVRSFMRSHGVAYTEVRSKPVLVLPVDQTGGTPVLWQAETGWRQTWADLPLQGGLVPVTVPYGEAPDVADIGADQALAGDAAALRRIAERYQAGDVAVAVLTTGGSGAVTATITLHPASGNTESFSISQPAVPPTAGAPVQGDPTLREAVTKVVNRLEERWTAANVVVAGNEGGLTVKVAFTTQNEWVETRRRLSKIPTITQTRVVALARDGAELELRYIGGLDQLRTALAQQDLTLTESGGTSELRWRGAQPPTTAPAPTAATVP